MDPLHLTDPAVLAVGFGALTSGLGTILLWNGRQILKRLDTLNGSVADHEKRLIETTTWSKSHDRNQITMDKSIRDLSSNVNRLTAALARLEGQQNNHG